MEIVIQGEREEDGIQRIGTEKQTQAVRQRVLELSNMICSFEHLDDV